MSAVGDCTIYVPGVPLNKQLQLYKTITPVVKQNLVRIPYKFGLVEFKPLKINDKIYTFLLMMQTTSGLFTIDKDDGVPPRSEAWLYEEYKFTIKNADGSIYLKDVPSENIEAVIKKLFTGTLKPVADAK